MRTSTLGLFAAGALVAGVIAAPTAIAYDKAGYTYAAGHLLPAKQIPKVLGVYRANPGFSVDPDNSSIYLCYVSDTETDVRVRAKNVNYSGFYRNAQRNSTKNVSMNMYEFRTSQGAISAFRSLEREAKKCTGTSNSSFQDDDSGVTYTWSSTKSNGKVPSVTVAGVASVFVNVDYINGSSDRDGQDLSDSYSVYTLVNNVILQTNYSIGNAAQLTPAERKGAHQLAFNNVTAWLG
jgi:hypothetical protein